MTTHTAACKALRYVAAFECAGECQTFPPAPERTDASTCYVCGSGPHAPTELHVFWSVADAARDFAREDARLGGGHDAAAAYVEQHRPY